VTLGIAGADGGGHALLGLGHAGIERRADLEQLQIGESRAALRAAAASRDGRTDGLRASRSGDGIGESWRASSPPPNSLA
jgi:hypothetical protein